MEAVLAHRLDPFKLEWDERSAVCVVLASEGYPGDYQKGNVIVGLDQVKDASVVIFHSGTKRDGDQIVTAGGRVLGVTGLGSDVQTARTRVYEAIDRIQFSGMQYRSDIGK
jgi:phosphoribosylamine--glycine ligase